MSSLYADHKKLLSALDEIFARYFDEKDELSTEKTSQDKFWGTYLRAMKDEDESRPKDWDGNTGSILTFTGLFAATVAAFVIESYKSLSPDSGDQTVALLGQILAATTDSASDSNSVSSSIEAFRAPLHAVLANALWFVSLVVALACALLATLVQQWSRDYVRDIKQRESLDEDFASRALNHAYIRMGVDRYGLDKVVDLIVSLVHLAVILFATGLLLFLYPINTVISGCTTFTLGVFGLVYFIATIVPIRDTSCPYRTPLTYPCNVGYSLVHSIVTSTYHRTHLDNLLQWLSGRDRHLTDSVARIGQLWVTTVTTLQGIKVHILPSALLIKQTKRKRTRIVWDMSFSQFKFVWRHVSRHLINADASALKILLQSLVEILSSMSAATSSECLTYILNNDSLAIRLDDVARFDAGSEDADTRIAALSLACVMVRHMYVGTDMWQFEKHQLTIRYCLHTILFALGGTPLHTTLNQDVGFTLTARLLIFRLRYSLLLQVRDASSGKNALSTPTSDSHYLSIELGPDAYTDPYGQLFERLLHRYQLLDEPQSLLSLLNSWQYNPLEGCLLRSTHRSWKEDMTSCLVPLHDDTCCRRRDGPLEHVAACAVLTVIAHILRASETHLTAAMNSPIFDQLFEYVHLWDYRAPFRQWARDFEMSHEDCERAPSPEFLSVLHDAGLDVWLEVGNDLSYIPPTNSPYGRLSEYDDTLLKALRALVQHVNIGRVHSSLPKNTHRSSDPGSSATSITSTSQLCPQDVVNVSIVSGNTSGHPKTGHIGPPIHLHERGSFDLEHVVVSTASGTVDVSYGRGDPHSR